MKPSLKDFLILLKSVIYNYVQTYFSKAIFVGAILFINYFIIISNQTIYQPKLLAY